MVGKSVLGFQLQFFLHPSVRPSDPIRCAFVVRRVTRPSLSPSPSTPPVIPRRETNLADRYGATAAVNDVALDGRNLCIHCVAGRIEDAVKREEGKRRCGETMTTC